MRSVIDILDLTVEELDELVNTALDIIDNPGAQEKIMLEIKFMM